MDTRSEADTMGTVEVPAARYWGAQTQRSLENFRIGGERMPLAVVRALALVKRAAASCNERLGRLDAPRAEAIRQACDEIVEGRRDEEFPLVVWQTGSGTQTNMNVNEVVANRASELMGGKRGDRSPVHPNDHVNLSQSSNDAFPSAVYVAAVLAVERELGPALTGLEATFAEKAAAFHDVMTVGRTHLMDATPLTVGQELSGHAAQLGGARASLERALAGVRELAIGGTAVGTGLHAPPGWDRAMVEEIARLAGSAFEAAPNKFEALSAHDAIVELHGALRRAACALMKLANDLRWLASGPRCGLGDLLLPANEPGSSIMPGKVNPTQCEALRMVCARVLGNDTTMSIAGSSGDLQLNVFKPLMAHVLLESITLLGDAARSFTIHCAAGLEVDRARVAQHLERSLMRVTALTPAIGYDRAAEVAKRAHAENKTLRQVAVDDLRVVSAEDFERLMAPFDAPAG